MVKYRRNYIPGGTYFFTLTLRDRKSNYLTQHADKLTAAMRRVNKLHPYKTIALVILPDHLHAIWELPENDANYSLRWRCIKTLFVKNLKKEDIAIINNASGESMLWQRRFWEHTIRNEIDYENHLNYIHYNPVKHGLALKVADWPFSTFHRYVKDGILPANWSYQNEDLDLE